MRVEILEGCWKDAGSAHQCYTQPWAGRVKIVGRNVYNIYVITMQLMKIIVDTLPFMRRMHHSLLRRVASGYHRRI
jgi:hypothetical protein